MTEDDNSPSDERARPLVSDMQEKATVLLVNFDAAQRPRCNRALGLRFQFQSVESLAEAKALLERETPQAMVVALGEDPEPSYRFCRALQNEARTADLPTLFAHKNFAGVDHESTLDCGISDFIARPLHAEEFRRRMHNLLELAKLRGVRHVDNYVDQDTGVGNRARFLQLLRLEWLRNRRSLSPLSVLVASRSRADGRAVSSIELARVATLMEATLRRAGDVACRIDDHQFACVLPNTDLEGAQTVTRALYELFAEFNEEGTGSKTHNLSVGTASVVPHHPLSGEQLFAAARDALAQACEDGPNAHRSVDLDDDDEDPEIAAG